jgi:hypothetical protein
MTEAATPERRRDIYKDGVQIVAPLYIELRNWLNHYFSRRAYQREAQGLRVLPGEKKGASHGMARLLCWYASLCDEDIELIQEQGGILKDDLDTHPPDYGKRLGRDDPLTIPRRTTSVFRNPLPRLRPCVGPENSADVPGVKYHGQYEVGGGDRAETDDQPIDRDRTPGRGR